MALFFIRKHSRQILQRYFSVHGMKKATLHGLVNISIDNDTGVATLELNKPPVNSMTYDLLEDIVSSVDIVENQNKCTGIVWTSSVFEKNKTFCSGLDVLDITDPTPEHIRRLWMAFHDMGLRLFSCRLPTVGALNGHCMAGGMVLPLSADYNICADGSFIFGFNATAFGVYVPFWVQQMFIRVIGNRKAEYYLKLGKLFGLHEALSLGIVNKIVEPDTLLQSAEHEIQKWIKVPYSSQSLTKFRLRESLIKDIIKRRDEEIEFYINQFTDPQTVLLLKSHTEKMKSRKTNN